MALPQRMPLRQFSTELWHEYCSISHLHGFHEMHMHRGLWTRIFWIITILGGFAFAIFLAIMGCRQFFSDPVNTHVTINKTGAIDLKFLYCPANWIDKDKITKYNASMVELHYALSHLNSYLEVVSTAYQAYFHGFVDGPSLGSADAITWYIGDWVLITRSVLASVRMLPTPSYYSNVSADILNQYTDDKSKQLCAAKGCFCPAIFAMLTLNDTKSLFKTLYDHMPISTATIFDIWSYLKFGFVGTPRPLNLTYAEVNRSLPNITGCTTLKLLDTWVNGSDELEFVDCGLGDLNISFCDYVKPELAKNIIIEFLFSQLFRDDWIHPHWESFYKLKTDMVLQIVVEDIQKEGRFQVEPEDDDRETLKKYLLQSSNVTAELIRLVSAAEAEFVKRERKRYQDFLANNNFKDTFDFLLNISFDLNSYFVALSYSKRRQAGRAVNGHIKGTKTLSGKGVCVRFHVSVSQGEESLTAVPLFKNQRTGTSKTSQNLYVYVMPINMASTRYFQFPYYGSTGITDAIVFGNSISDMVLPLDDKESDDDQINGQEYTFLVPYRNDFANTWYVTNVQNMKFQDRSGSACKEQVRDEPSDYTYNNCILTCDDYYTQPKWGVQRASINKPALYYPIYCYFARENLVSLLPPTPRDIPICSYFTCIESILASYQNSKNTLLVKEQFDNVSYVNTNITRSNCMKTKCIRECTAQYFDIKMDNQTLSANVFAIIQFSQPSPLEELPDELISDDPEKLSHFPDLTIFGNYINNKKAFRKRIEIVIESGSINYEEQFSSTWDAVFGQIGGQIGMVTGASLLTLVQLLWIVLRALYRHFVLNHYRGTAPDQRSSSTSTASSSQNSTKRLFPTKLSWKIRGVLSSKISTSTENQPSNQGRHHVFMQLDAADLGKTA